MREYLRGEILVCKLIDEKLVSLPSGEETGLTYRGDLGVGIPQWQAVSECSRRDVEEDEDESYD